MNFSLTASISIFMLTLLTCASARAEDDELFNLSLEQLLAVKVKSTAFIDETLLTTSYSVTPTYSSDWEKMGARNLGDVLNHMPSTIAPLGFGQSRVVAIRGYFDFGSPRGTAVRFDGVPMNKLREGGGLMAIDGFDLNLLQSAELIRGPGSSLHGNDAFHGVLSLESLTMDRTGASTTLGVGTMSDHHLAINSHYQSDDFSLSGVFAHRLIGDAEQEYTYFDSTLNESFDSSRSNKRENSNALIKYKGQLHENLSAYVTYMAQDFDAEQLPGIGDDESVGDGQKSSDWTAYADKTQLLKIGGSYQWNDFTNTDFSIYQWHYDDHYYFDALDVPAVSIINNSFREETHLGLLLHHSHAFSDISNIALGYEFHSQQLDDFYSDLIFANAPTTVVRTNYDEVGYKREVHSVVIDGHQALIKNKLTLLYGSRVDSYNDFNTQFSPRVGFSYWLYQDHTLHLTYGEAFRAPALFEQFGGFRVLPNPDLKPETLKSIELKYSLKAEHWFHAFTLFTNTWDEGIQTQVVDNGPNGVMAQFQNYGQNNAHGLEVESKGRWQSWEVNFHASYIRSKNKQTNENYHAFPHLIIDAGLGYNLKNWTIYNSNRFSRRSAISTATPADEHENYFRSDLVAQWATTDHLQMSFSLKNIFNRDNSLPSTNGHSDGLQDESQNAAIGLRYTF